MDSNQELLALSQIFPSNLFNEFDLISSHILCDLKNKEEYYEFFFDEKNIKPAEYATDQLVSKGFSHPKTIQDFPIRGRAVYLLIRRRRWQIKDTNETCCRDLSFLSKGSKFTFELDAFLKENH
jgi:transposase